MKNLNILLIPILCLLNFIGISQNGIRQITCVGLTIKDVATQTVQSINRDDAMILRIDEKAKGITVKTATRFNGNFFDEYYYKDFIQSPYAKIYTCFKKNESTNQQFFISVLDNKVTIMYEKLIFEGNIKNDVTFDSKVNENKSPKTSKGEIGYIKGTNVLLRGNHSTKSKIVGSFKSSGEEVEIVGTYIEDKSQALISEDISFSINDLNYQLKKGKALNLIEEKDDYYTVSFKGKDLNEQIIKLEKAYVSISDFSKWYKIKRKNGQIGWVYGKFITN